MKLLDKLIAVNRELNRQNDKDDAVIPEFVVDTPLSDHEIAAASMMKDYYFNLVDKVHRSTYAHVEVEIAKLNKKIDVLDKDIPKLEPLPPTASYEERCNRIAHERAFDNGEHFSAETKRLVEIYKSLHEKRRGLQKELQRIKYENMPNPHLLGCAKGLDIAPKIDRAHSQLAKLIEQLWTLVPALRAVKFPDGYEPPTLQPLRSAVANTLNACDAPKGYRMTWGHVDRVEVLMDFTAEFSNYQREVETRMATEEELAKLANTGGKTRAV